VAGAADNPMVHLVDIDVTQLNIFDVNGNRTHINFQDVET